MSIKPEKGENPWDSLDLAKNEKDKMKDGLEKTRTGFWGNIMNTLTGSKIDDDLYDELEEQLILADVGGDVAMKLVDALRDRVQEKGLKTGEQAADALRDIIADEMRPEAEMALDGHPAVILVIGVNGVGKTTSIAKLADYYTRQGKKGHAGRRRHLPRRRQRAAGDLGGPRRCADRQGRRGRRPRRRHLRHREVCHRPGPMTWSSPIRPDVSTTSRT